MELRGVLGWVLRALSRSGRPTRGRPLGSFIVDLFMEFGLLIVALMFARCHLLPVLVCHLRPGGRWGVKAFEIRDAPSPADHSPASVGSTTGAPPEDCTASSASAPMGLEAVHSCFRS